MDEEKPALLYTPGNNPNASWVAALALRTEGAGHYVFEAYSITQIEKGALKRLPRDLEVVTPNSAREQYDFVLDKI